MEKLTGIIILNYNSSNDTLKCIEKIRACFFKNYIIYIVDNCSRGDDIEKIEKKLSHEKRIKLLLSNKNLGYSAGNNIGARVAIKDGCDTILVINPDVEVQNDILSAMLPYISERNGITVVAPRVIDINGGNGQRIRKNYSFHFAIFNKKPLYYLKDFFDGDVYYDYDPEKSFLFEGSPSGCCFLVSSKEFEQIGFFDENVFLYCEEYILGKKISDKGHKCIYIPEAIVKHREGSSTSQKHNLFSTFHMYASEYYLLTNYCDTKYVQRVIIKFLRILNFIIKSFVKKDLSLIKKFINTLNKIESGKLNYRITM